MSNFRGQELARKNRKSSPLLTVFCPWKGPFRALSVGEAEVLSSGHGEHGKAGLSACPTVWPGTLLTVPTPVSSLVSRHVDCLLNARPRAGQ